MALNEMSAGRRLSTLADAARHAIVSLPTMTGAYSTALTTRAAWQSLRGDQVAALENLLRALRAVGATGFSPAHQAKLRSLIAGFCSDPAGRLLPASQNRLLSHFQSSARAAALRIEFSRYAIGHRVRLRYPREPEDGERQGDLIVLKRADTTTGEKGVLLLTYTEALDRFAALFDVAAVAADYQIVLEPSSWGYEDPAFLRYLAADMEVVVQAPWRRDFQFIADLRSNLVPVRVGAGDWTDPQIFRPKEGPGRRFDVVMVSSWSPLKRHVELFRTLAQIKRRYGRMLRVALIGYPAGWTRRDIEALARRHGVDEACSIFESIPPEQVAALVADSSAYVLLSRREGANRALYEAIFCDTPIVVHRRHRGVNTDQVVPQVGVLFEDGGLAEAILALVDDPGRFTPRAWAMEHTGYVNATRQINDALRRCAEEKGRPWTRDITPKKNIPNLRYAQPGTYVEFEEEYRRLERYLLPV